MSKNIFATHRIDDKYGDHIEVSASPSELFVAVQEDVICTIDPAMVSLTRVQAELLINHLERLVSGME